MKEQIERTLAILIGMQWHDAGRAASLEWFHFGSPATDSAPAPAPAAYVLHVQCAWRLHGPTGIIVGSADRYLAAGPDPFKDYEEFDWDRPGANRCDERMAQHLQRHAAHPLVVQGIEGDAIGNLSLLLSAHHRLDIFPDSSLEGEHWRFFRHHAPLDEDHFVVTGRGIET